MSRLVHFYHIQLESGKEIWINPAHIVYAELRNIAGPEWQIKMDNGDIFNFYIQDKLDNIALSKDIKTSYVV